MEFRRDSEVVVSALALELALCAVRPATFDMYASSAADGKDDDDGERIMESTRSLEA